MQQPRAKAKRKSPTPAVPLPSSAYEEVPPGGTVAGIQRDNLELIRWLAEMARP